MRPRVGRFLKKIIVISPGASLFIVMQDSNQCPLVPRPLFIFWQQVFFLLVEDTTWSQSLKEISEIINTDYLKITTSGKHLIPVR